ncbi:hypothetical protein [uncultured Tateyamaria sp.]|uniref:hypothetical protein n=1 Tax=uncultured Tateyamaria sp. TaxID=455651 RepID=UPI00262F9F3D|nr:hypothetical protein [uncultured Tateyamaria sp.]
MAITASACFPEFPRVCEKRQSGSKFSLEVIGFWLGIGQVFGEFDPLCFEFVDLGLERAFGGGAGRVDQTICRFADLRLNPRQFGLLRFPLGLPLRDTPVPDVFEHLSGDGDQSTTWRQRL